jgi:hypothetical protein
LDPIYHKSAFGEPHGSLGGRLTDDSFVGGLGSTGSQYNASAGLRPWYEFGTAGGRLRLTKSSKKDQRSRSLSEKERGLRLTESSKKGQRSRSLGEKERGKGNERIGAEENETQPLRLGELELTHKYDGTLSVKGFPLGHVQMTSSKVLEKGVIPVEAFELGGWKIGDQNIPDQLWRTLVGDRGPNGTRAPSYYRRACLECLQHTDRVGNLDIESVKHKKGMPSLAIRYLERAQRVVWGRRFFTTGALLPKAKERWSDPLFGLGPSYIKEGDMICILFGCSVPVILRKIVGKTDDVHFEFIGECYVHGVMDGQAVALKDSRSLAWPYSSKLRGFMTFNLK